jgi:L-ascorbate metabolism protein UlaG (beta-lactamase superfamily)
MPNGQKYRLADSTIIEPLVNSWSAWSFLISPVTASLHLMNYQIKTLESYLKDPAYHFQASRDPSLIGGPFVHVPSSRAAEVRQLLDSTRQKQGETLVLAASIRDFHNWLVEEAKGQSLEPYYQRLPDSLRGYVELVYDYYNRPTVRFFERLLYKSKYYDKSLQSFRLSPFTTDSCRPFFMSTPRLMEDDHIDWQVPYDDLRVDELFKLDNEPQHLGHVRDILGLTSASDNILLPLLTTEPQPRPERRDGEQVRVRYFGHACVLIEWNGMSILTDPFIGARPVQGGIDRLTYGDLPDRIDYVLITHGHNDHFVLESLLRVRHKTDCLIVPRANGILYGDVSLKLMAEELGFRNVIEMDSFESIPLPGGELIAIPFLGEHADLPHAKTGYVVRAGGEQMLFGADSNCLDKRMYEKVRESIGPVQTVFLGTECVGAPLTWVYGTVLLKKQVRSHDQQRRLNGADSKSALQILEALDARRIYNYAMGQEPWLEHIMALPLADDSPQVRESDKLLAIARERGFHVAERLYGKAEFSLDTLPPEAAPYGLTKSREDDSTTNIPVAAERDDTEDRFIF